jgi:hypothetical protein
MSTLIGIPAVETTICTQVFTDEQVRSLCPGISGRSSHVSGTQFRRNRRCDVEEAAKEKHMRMQLPDGPARALFLSALSRGTHFELMEGLERHCSAVFMECPGVGDVRKHIVQSPSDLVVFHYSLGKQLIDQMCTAVRLESPVSWIFNLKPRHEDRYSQMTDDELNAWAEASDILYAMRMRVGLA